MPPDPAQQGSATAADVVLIHGLWMTPLCWEHWTARFESAGHVVHAPAWPGVEAPIEEIRRDPSPLSTLGVKAIADHYESYIRGLPRAPILMGHSFGGLIVQLLLDRGVGAAGVSIDPAPPRGIYFLPPSALRVASVALRNPANRKRTVELSPKQFHYAFGNLLSRADSDAVRDRYAIPGPGRPLFEAALANFSRHAVSAVDFEKGDRAPLLLVAGGKDHIAPASVTRATAKKYRGAAVTELAEFPDRSHYTVGEEGWETVADRALLWATSVGAGSGASQPTP
jgi:pimeloyl-ACP methyl ester carboxylesterase